METPTNEKAQQPIISSFEKEENKEPKKDVDEEFAEQVEEELCQMEEKKKEQKDKMKDKKEKKHKHSKHNDKERKDKKKDKERNPELEKLIKEEGKRLQYLLSLKLQRQGVKYNPNKVRKMLRKQIWKKHKCANHKHEMRANHKWHMIMHRRLKKYLRETYCERMHRQRMLYWQMYYRRMWNMKIMYKRWQYWQMLQSRQQSQWYYPQTIQQYGNMPYWYYQQAYYSPYYNYPQWENYQYSRF